MKRKKAENKEHKNNFFIYLNRNKKGLKMLKNCVSLKSTLEGELKFIKDSLRVDMPLIGILGEFYLINKMR